MNTPITSDNTNLTSGVQEALDNCLDAIQAVPPEERDRLRKENDEFRARRRGEEVRAIIKDSCAPLRHLQNKNLDRAGDWGATERKILNRLGTGFFIGLIGTRGSGKTQVCVEVIRANAQNLKRSRFCTATEFIMEVKATFGSEATRSEKDVVAQFTRSSLLVIDEIGQRSENDWENRLLFQLLNCRYNEMKDTLVCSNQSFDQFAKSIGPSLLSRMQETGGLIECNWASYRAPDCPANGGQK